MPDYLPIFKPGTDITLTASAAVTGGQLCAVSGSGTVAPTGGPGVGAVGVAAFDVANGDKVALHCGGVQELTASGAITAGDAVVPAAAGRVAALGAGTNYAQVYGIALTTAADGAKVRVQANR